MRSFAIEDPGSPDPPLYATLPIHDICQKKYATTVFRQKYYAKNAYFATFAKGRVQKNLNKNNKNILWLWSTFVSILLIFYFYPGKRQSAAQKQKLSWVIGKNLFIAISGSYKRQILEKIEYFVSHFENISVCLNMMFLGTFFRCASISWFEVVSSTTKRDIGMGPMSKMMLTYRATNALLTNSGFGAVLTVFCLPEVGRCR